MEPTANEPEGLSGQPVSGIYQIRNRHTGRVYIGKSRDIASRWLAHRDALDRGLHVNEHLQGDWEIYGEGAFEFTVLEVVSEFKSLWNAEARHLATFSNPYNVAHVLELKGRQAMPRQPVTARRFFELLYDEPLPDRHVTYALSVIAESTLGRLIFRLLDEQDTSILNDLRAFMDAGYRGLYNGETARDIKARKGLARGQHILDWMGAEELAANLFRATQTEAKLRREGITGKAQANATHFGVGREVRETIQRLGGTMPEDLPTPTESIQALQRREQERLEAERQPSLFAPTDDGDYGA